MSATLSGCCPVTGDEKSGVHSVIITSTAVLIVAIMLLFMAILSPALSPITAMADWDGDGVSNDKDAFPRDPSEWIDTDGDGVGDNRDMFPRDRNQTADSDGDGVGDERDFWDGGNGGIKISLTSFVFKNYTGGTYQWRKTPNPMFKIQVDVDNSGSYDLLYESPVMSNSTALSDFYSVTVDLPDDTTSIRFTITVYDMIDVNAGKIEIIDYWPQDGAKSAVHVVSLPCSLSWSSTGVGDTDSPDCDLDYAIATLTVPG